MTKSKKIDIKIKEFTEGNVKINFDKNTIEYIDIFGNKVENNIHNDVMLFDKDKCKLLKGNFILLKYKTRHGGSNTALIFLYEDKYLSRKKDEISASEMISNYYINRKDNFYSSVILSTGKKNIKLTKKNFDKEKAGISSKGYNGYIQLAYFNLVGSINNSVRKENIGLLYNIDNYSKDVFRIKDFITLFKGDGVTYKLEDIKLNSEKISILKSEDLNSVSRHDDCCGVKIASRHPYNNFIHLKDARKFVKETYFKKKGTTEEIIREYHLNIMGFSQIMFHVLNNQKNTAIAYYETIFGKNSVQQIHEFENPNGGNVIYVYIVDIIKGLYKGDISRKNNYQSKSIFAIFLRQWFENLERLDSGVGNNWNPVYDKNFKTTFSTIIPLTKNVEGTVEGTVEEKEVEDAIVKKKESVPRTIKKKIKAKPSSNRGTNPTSYILKGIRKL